MKALDTNVLVRFLMADDPQMSARACAVLSKAETSGFPMLVTMPVLMELLWVLRSRYRLDNAAIAAADEQLLAMPALRFEQGAAAGDFAATAPASNLEPGDLMIAIHARHLGAGAVVTFDHRAARSTLFELPD